MRCCSIARRYPERFVDNTSKAADFRQEEDSDLDRGVLISAVALLIAGLWIALFAPKLGREWDILNVSCLGIGFFGGKNNEERTSAPHVPQAGFLFNRYLQCLALLGNDFKYSTRSLFSSLASPRLLQLS
jgi:hypothetical protein